MRIARIEVEGVPRAAVVSGNGESARVLAPEVSDGAAARRRRGRAGAARGRRRSARSGWPARACSPRSQPHDGPRLLRVRAAHRGRDQERRIRTRGCRALVRVAVLLLLQPARGHRAGRRHPRAARVHRPRLRARGGGGDRPPGSQPARPRRPARISPATRYSTTGRRATFSSPRCALGLGICKGKDFANTLGPWIVTADELERLPRRRPARPRHARVA